MTPEEQADAENLLGCGVVLVLVIVSAIFTAIYDPVAFKEICRVIFK
jgi:hypothetical protein